MAAGFGLLGAPDPAGGLLRRSVMDPVTGRPLVTSAPTGAVRQRGELLPIGRDDDGRLVPATPQWVFDAIDAARFPGQVLAGERGVFDPATGHVSDEAMAAANGIAGLAMTGGLGGVAAAPGEAVLAAGAPRRLTYDSPVFGRSRMTEQGARDLLAQRERQIAEQAANPAFGSSPPSFHAEVAELKDLLPKFAQDALPRGRPFEPLRTVEGDGPHAVRVKEYPDAPGEREYRVYDRLPGGGFSRPRGSATVTQEPDGRWRTDMLETRYGHEGRGLATSLYDALERDTGQKRVPSGQLLEDGYRFWLKRDPDAVQFHQPFDGQFWSPRRLSEYLEDGVYAADPAKLAEMQAAYAAVPAHGRTPEAMARQLPAVAGLLGAGAAGYGLLEEHRP